MSCDFAEDEAACDSSCDGDQKRTDCERFDADFTFLADAAPPVPPAVKCEDDEEELEKCVGEQARAVEDDEVENVCGEDDGPADEESLCCKPDAEGGGDEAGELDPGGGEVVRDDS